ncbi:acetamidase [Hyaloraphidium curvatum]|nr:acetamidase [Hyaloraphidium curvatum]
MSSAAFPGIVPSGLPLDDPYFVYGVLNPAELGKPSPLLPPDLRTVSSLDPTIPCFDPRQPTPYHNRFHPLIPPVASVAVGELVRAECWDATGGQMKSDAGSAADMAKYQGELTHVVSGPYEVQGAEPGDLIEVEVVEMDVLSGNEWGYTGVPGAITGFLADHLPKAAKAIWDLSSRTHGTSSAIPHVRLPRMFHLGVVATAPSQEIVDTINARERGIWEQTGGDAAVPLVACLPSDKLALVGRAAGSDADKARKEGLRTIPPRPENGGNMDIRELGPGAKIIMPVHVPGANLSLGDPHFCEGEGEICGEAVECGAQFAWRITRLIKKGMETLRYKAPMFIPNPAFIGGPPSLAGSFLCFSGYSVSEPGFSVPPGTEYVPHLATSRAPTAAHHHKHAVQHNADVTLAFRNALLAAIAFLTGEPYFYSKYQAAAILSAGPISSRISCVVDIPNACVTVWIPTGIFEKAISFGGDGSAWAGNSREKMGDLAF